MTDQSIESSGEKAAMGETGSDTGTKSAEGVASPTDDRLSGPGAGLGATGRTADDFDPGDPVPGADYGDPGGTATAEDEELAPRSDAGDDADGPGSGR